MDRQRRGAQQRPGGDRGIGFARGERRCGGDQRRRGGGGGRRAGGQGLGRERTEQGLHRACHGGLDRVHALRAVAESEHAAAPKEGAESHEDQCKAQEDLKQNL